MNYDFDIVNQQSFVGCFLTCGCCSEPRKDAANESSGHNDGEDVRPPLPVIRETLYDDAMLFGYALLFLIYLFALETKGFAADI